MQYMYWGWDARGIYGDSLRADPRFHRPIKDWSTEDLHLYIEACREARISLSKDNARLREKVNKAMELLESDPDSRLRRMFELFETRRDSDEKLKALARERIEIAKLLSEDPSPATVIALVARLQGIII